MNAYGLVILQHWDKVGSVFPVMYVASQIVGLEKAFSGFKCNDEC